MVNRASPCRHLLDNVSVILDVTVFNYVIILTLDNVFTLDSKIEIEIPDLCQKSNLKEVKKENM